MQQKLALNKKKSPFIKLSLFKKYFSENMYGILSALPNTCMLPKTIKYIVKDSIECFCQTDTAYVIVMPIYSLSVEEAINTYYLSCVNVLHDENHLIVYFFEYIPDIKRCMTIYFHLHLKLA